MLIICLRGSMESPLCIQREAALCAKWDSLWDPKIKPAARKKPRDVLGAS